MILIDDTLACVANIDLGGVGSTIYTPMLTPNTYSITINFIEDEYYLESEKAIDLIIEKENTIINIGNHHGEQGEIKAITAKITDDEGNNIQGKTINFYIDDIYIGSATKTADGESSINYIIPADATPGTCNLKAEFIGDDYYKSSEATSTFEIHETITEITCPYCDGSGHHSVSIDCPSCGGTGIHEVACIHCGRTGKRLVWIPCDTCGGSGEVRGAFWGCGGSGRVCGMLGCRTCPACKGSGELDYICPTCFGFKGHYTWVTCEYCGGDGLSEVSCSTCGGTGCIEDEVPCLCCLGNGKLTFEEFSRFPQLNEYCNELYPIIENFNEIMNNIFVVLFEVISITTILTLGFSYAFFLNLLAYLWDSLINNPSKMDSVLSIIITQKYIIISHIPRIRRSCN